MIEMCYDLWSVIDRAIFRKQVSFVLSFTCMIQNIRKQLSFSMAPHFQTPQALTIEENRDPCPNPTYPAKSYLITYIRVPYLYTLAL